VESCDLYWEIEGIEEFTSERDGEKYTVITVDDRQGSKRPRKVNSNRKVRVGSTGTICSQKKTQLIEDGGSKSDNQ
jgi:hypothetical protein